MVSSIDREKLRTLIEDGGQVVDVLPEREYKESHIPGAVNIPLRNLDSETTALLQRDKPVVVYCHDGL